MGSHLSVKHQEPIHISPHSHLDAEHYVCSTESRVRRIAKPVTVNHPRQVYNVSVQSSHQPCTALEALFTDFGDKLLSTEDAQLLSRIFRVKASAPSTSRRTANRVRNSQSESSNAGETHNRSQYANNKNALFIHQHPRQTAPLNGHQFRQNRLNSCSLSGEQGRHSEVSLLHQKSVHKPVKLTNTARQALISFSLTASQSISMTDKISLLIGQDKRCVFCKRLVPREDQMLHFSVYLDHPQVAYNEEKISVEKGECPICLEDLKPGDSIARLPCLCIYHKGCIDDWFEHKKTCPEHPEV